jgi:hypothetical protein
MEYLKKMARKPAGRNNAVTHGAYAEHLILPGESIDKFSLLHRALIDEWKPIGALEEDTVLSIAHCIWQKRRVERFYYREARGGKDQDDIRFVLYLTDLLEKVQTLEDATTLTSNLPENYQRWIAQEVPRTKFEDDKTWIQSLAPKILELVPAHWQYATAKESLEFRAAYLRELTAKRVTLDERLDARIDKLIKRLLQLKTCKQILKECASHTPDIRSISTNDNRQVPY